MVNQGFKITFVEVGTYMNHHRIYQVDGRIDAYINALRTIKGGNSMNFIYWLLHLKWSREAPRIMKSILTWWCLPLLVPKNNETMRFKSASIDLSSGILSRAKTSFANKVTLHILPSFCLHEILNFIGNICELLRPIPSFTALLVKRMISVLRAESWNGAR